MSFATDAELADSDVSSTIISDTGLLHQSSSNPCLKSDTKLYVHSIVQSDSSLASSTSTVSYSKSQ